MTLFGVGGNEPSSGFYPYSINYSVRFNDADTPSMTITPSASNRDKWTFSTWVKRCNIPAFVHTILAAGNDNQTHRTYFLFNSSHKLVFVNEILNIQHTRLVTTRVFKDTMSWMHLVLVYDSAQATASNRAKIYVNGVRETDFDTENYGNLNQDTYVGGAYPHIVGNSNYSAEANPWYLDAYLSETHYLDGVAQGPEEFAESQNGIWVPIQYTGSYGTNGWYLDYSNSANFGEDQSGNNNDLTDSGLASTDQVIDTPTNNHCVLNYVHHKSTGNIYDGNLLVNGTENEFGTFGMKTGKWAWEITVSESGSFGIEAEDGTEEVLADVIGEVVEMEFNADAGTLKKRVDGGSLETIEAAVDTTLTWFPYFKAACSVDFGQLGFTPTDPDYKTLCFESIYNSGEIDEDLYVEGNKGMDAVIYTGSGAEKAITDLEFQPDVVWIKNRDTTDQHVFVDSVRGATKELNPDSTATESIVTQGVKSIDSNGFTLGTDARYNTNTEAYASWNWLESSDYGFDIVTYEGTGVAKEVSHNLGVVPEIMIVKDIDTADSWYVYHKDMDSSSPENYYQMLDLQNARATSALWNNIAPTSSIFNVGTPDKTNKNGDTFMAYLWASVPGYSKIDYYIGNGSTDGAYIYLGFKPKWIMIKNTTVAATSWPVMDSVRTPINIEDSYWLYPDSTNVEGTGINVDILSNGIKMRNTSGWRNTNSVRYIYMAFAETPFPWANAL